MHRTIGIMSRFLGVLTAFLLSAAAFAANVDLAVTLDAPDTVQGGETFTVRGTVTNKGPDAATDITLNFGSSDHGLCYDAVTIEPLAAGASRAFQCSVTATTPPYRIFIEIHAYAQADPNWRDNRQQKSVQIITAPDLVIWSIPTGTQMPGLPYRQGIAFANLANTTATAVKLTITSQARIVGAPELCTVDGERAVCAIGTMLGGQGQTLSLDVIAPDVSEHPFTVTATIAGNEGDANPADNSASGASRTYRTFFVTNTADAGSGSLRAAIEGSSSCTGDYPCLIAFRIPTAAQQWQTIRVESPLPPVTGQMLVIDGATQAGYFGDSNPHGPEIEISGSPEAGNGLEVLCDAYIRKLVINGFPGAGVSIRGSDHCAFAVRGVVETYLGVDPTGERAVPNERGIDMHSPRFWWITHNVISGNRRAGIFIAEGPNTRISNNVIGLNARMTAPLGNGASGVYIGSGGAGTDLTDNHVSFNGHFGVAIARATQNVALHGNSFQANHQQAIDWGLDGAPSEQEIGIPRITSVRYENGTTVIEGIAKPGGTFLSVNLYANDAPDPSGYGEGQYYLGRTGASSGDGRFTFTHPGDLRGKWVAATQTRTFYFGWLRTEGADQGAFTTTSEFSLAVEVH